MPELLDMKLTNKSLSSTYPKNWGRFCITALFLYLQLAVVETFASENSQKAIELLNKMTVATKQHNYDGTFVYIRGKNVSSMRIIHKAEGDNEIERLISLSGPAAEVIRNNKEVKCFFPSHRSVMVDKRAPQQLLGAALPQPVQSIADYYNFSVLGGDRVVARPTWIVEIKPKTSDRYGYRLWVDNSSHLLLKSDVIDKNDAILEQVLFTSIALPSTIHDSSLKPEISGKGYTWDMDEDLDEKSKSSAEAQSSPEWKMTWLPDGFKMEEDKYRAMSANSELTKHLVYSDGLASFSIFIEKESASQPSVPESTSIGALNAYSQVVESHQITAVGELPMETLQKLVESITHENEH